MIPEVRIELASLQKLVTDHRVYRLVSSHGFVVSQALHAGDEKGANHQNCADARSRVEDGVRAACRGFGYANICHEVFR